MHEGVTSAWRASIRSGEPVQLGLSAVGDIDAVVELALLDASLYDPVAGPGVKAAISKRPVDALIRIVRSTSIAAEGRVSRRRVEGDTRSARK
jgi:hypothetical protein